jgi:hypothetical protein
MRNPPSLSHHHHNCTSNIPITGKIRRAKLIVIISWCRASFRRTRSRAGCTSHHHPVSPWCRVSYHRTHNLEAGIKYRYHACSRSLLWSVIFDFDDRRSIRLHSYLLDRQLELKAHWPQAQRQQEVLVEVSYSTLVWRLVWFQVVWSRVINYALIELSYRSGDCDL